MISLNNKYSMFPDDRSNEFGSANDLGEGGGLFDYYDEDNLSAETDFFAQPSESHYSPPAEPVYPNENAAGYESAYPHENAAGYEPVETVPATPSEEVPKNSAAKKRGSIKIKLIGAVIAVAACAAVFFCTHAIFGELTGKHAFYSYGATEIDLSGSHYKDYSQLSKVHALEVVDLTDSSFDSLSVLYDCKHLKEVILTDRELSAEDCIAFYRHLPNAHLVCSVNINGQVYDSGITSLTVEHADSDTQQLYASLNRLKMLDMTACRVSDDTYRLLDEALPDCTVMIRTVIAGTEYTTDAEALTLSGTLSAEEADRVWYFKNLKSIDLRKCTNPDLLNDYHAAHPDVVLNNPIVLLGKQVGTEDESVDLRGSRFTLKQVKAALSEALPHMKSLKKIDMCGCGLSDRDMEKLCDAYPDIKFVWMVHFQEWDVRTDAVVFSALNKPGNKQFDQNDYAPLLKYCTELRAIDLGNSLITDISDFFSLKKLRAVILNGNQITDISAFSNLYDLELIEMNGGNGIKNADALRGLQNLRYVNFWSNKELTDLTPLYDHEKLEIAIFHHTVPQKERKWFKKSNPDCDTYYTVDSSMIHSNKQWRDNPYRKKLEKALQNWMAVVDFDESTGDYIFDYETNNYKYK